MKLCFVIEGILRNTGGAERDLRDIAGYLSHRGHDVEVLVNQKLSGSPFYRFDESVALVSLVESDSPRETFTIKLFQSVVGYAESSKRLRRIPPVSWLVARGKTAAFERRLGRHLRASRPDVAVAFMPAAILALAGARAETSLRRIAAVRSTPELDFEVQPGRADSHAYRKLLRDSLQRFDRISVLLPEFTRWFSPGLQERIVVLPNPIAPVSASLRVQERAPVILSVGRLHSVKRHDLLIEAWARIHHRFPDWRVEIWGKGKERVALQELIDKHRLADNVMLCGVTDDIASRYVSASVLVHPAIAEGFGNVIGEALAAGLPVVGFSDCSGLNSLVQHEHNGLLVSPRPDRVAALASSLCDLLERPEKREALGTAGPGSVEAYNPERMLAQWEGMLANAVNSTASSYLRATS